MCPSSHLCPQATLGNLKVPLLGTLKYRQISPLDGRAFSLFSNNLKPYKMPNSLPWGQRSSEQWEEQKNTQEDDTGVMKVLLVN